DRDRKSYAEAIQRLRDVPRSAYVFTSDEKPELADEVLKAFLEDVLPHIGALVRTTFQGNEARFKESEFLCVDLVQLYLSWGIVPSMLIHEQQEFVPDAVLLINAAYLFYLEGVSKLIERIKVDPKENQVPQRAKWSKRVEQWTLKSLEDLRLLTGKK